MPESVPKAVIELWRIGYADIDKITAFSNPIFLPIEDLRELEKMRNYIIPKADNESI
ncbi:MAG: hypothetical protein LBF70_00240 [Holosporales bacterium]|nr:hypothetical protein [Holosporales bacterium]